MIIVIIIIICPSPPLLALEPPPRLTPPVSDSSRPPIRSVSPPPRYRAHGTVCETRMGPQVKEITAWGQSWLGEVRRLLGGSPKPPEKVPDSP